jgi:hypothetical protein
VEPLSRDLSYLTEWPRKYSRQAKKAGIADDLEHFGKNRDPWPERYKQLGQSKKMVGERKFEPTVPNQMQFLQKVCGIYFVSK